MEIAYFQSLVPSEQANAIAVCPLDRPQERGYIDESEWGYRWIEDDSSTLTVKDYMEAQHNV